MVHTKAVRLFWEVTGVDQDLMRQIFSTFEESYLAHTHNRTKNSINETVADVLNHLQDK